MDIIRNPQKGTTDDIVQNLLDALHEVLAVVEDFVQNWSLVVGADNAQERGTVAVDDVVRVHWVDAAQIHGLVGDDVAQNHLVAVHPSSIPD